MMLSFNLSKKFNKYLKDDFVSHDKLMNYTSNIYSEIQDYDSLIEFINDPLIETIIILSGNEP